MEAEVPLVAREVGEGDADLAAALAARIGADRVSIAAADREAHARDLWPLSLLWLREGKIPPPPALVCRPRSTAEVAEVVRFAGERRIPLVPHGAGSGVCGGTIHLRGGIAIDLRAMDRVRTIDRDAMAIEVEAGALGWPLEQRLAAQGLTLGHYPSSIALSTVGGWIAACGAGQSSARYGKIEDLVLGLEVVLGTGEHLRLERPVRGSDLVELFLGSEGTLGVITAACLRLFDAPETCIPRAFRFPTLPTALAAMEAIFHEGLRPSVARLHDPVDTWIALGQADGDRAASIPPPDRDALRTLQERSPIGTPPAHERLERNAKAAGLRAILGMPVAVNAASSLLRACLLVLVHEGRGAETRAEARRVASICLSHGARDLGAGPAARWLRRRWAVSYELPRIFDAGAWVDTCEVATSWGRVEALYRAIRRAVRPHAFASAHFSHAWPDGCSIYFTFAGAAPTPAQGRRRYEATWRAALDACVAAGATITHHHGVGLLKARWLREELGPGGTRLFAAAKRACDPLGILNPGKLA